MSQRNVQHKIYFSLISFGLHWSAPPLAHFTSVSLHSLPHSPHSSPRSVPSDHEWRTEDVMSVTRKNEHEERQGKDDRKDPMLPADQRLLSSCRSFRAKTLSPLHCLFSCFLLSDSVLSRLIHHLFVRSLLNIGNYWKMMVIYFQKASHYRMKIDDEWRETRNWPRIKDGRCHDGLSASSVTPLVPSAVGRFRCHLPYAYGTSETSGTRRMVGGW